MATSNDRIHFIAVRHQDKAGGLVFEDPHTKCHVATPYSAYVVVNASDGTVVSQDHLPNLPFMEEGHVKYIAIVM